MSTLPTLSIESLSDPCTFEGLTRKRSHVVHASTPDCQSVPFDGFVQLEVNHDLIPSRHSAFGRIRNMFGSAPKQLQESKSAGCDSPSDTEYMPARVWPKKRKRRSSQRNKKRRKRTKPGKRCKRGRSAISCSDALHSIDTTVASSPPKRVIWKPALQEIYGERALLNALRQYMSQLYSIENLAFLESVRALKKYSEPSKAMDSHIVSIFEKHVFKGAMYEINLSYACFCNVMAQIDQIDSLSLPQRKALFDACVREIEYLVRNSILPGFYRSDVFQNVARSSPQYTTYLLRENNTLSPYTPVGADTEHDHELAVTTPVSISLSNPPIKLELSVSASCGSEDEM